MLMILFGISFGQSEFVHNCDIDIKKPTLSVLRVWRMEDLNLALSLLHLVSVQSLSEWRAATFRSLAGDI